MSKTAILKTSKNNRNPSAYIKSLPKDQQADAETLLKLFTDTTRVEGKMWGDSIIGFGEYHYKYASGREGDFLATGFSIRKSGPTLYIMPGYQNYAAILQNLGPHKTGKSCLYVKNLENINLNSIKELIKLGLRDLKKDHQVTLH